MSDLCRRSLCLKHLKFGLGSKYRQKPSQIAKWIATYFWKQRVVMYYLWCTTPISISDYSPFLWRIYVPLIKRHRQHSTTTITFCYDDGFYLSLENISMNWKVTLNTLVYYAIRIWRFTYYWPIGCADWLTRGSLLYEVFWFPGMTIN